MTDLTMSQFASKDDLIAAQAARIAELEAEVDAERHHHGIRNASAVRTLHALGYSWSGTDAWQPPAEQGKCLHQIAEPQADALRLADDCEESATHWVHEIDTRAKAAKMLRAQHARIAELEQRLEIDPRHRYDGISARDATIEAQDERIEELESQLEAIGAGGVEPLRKGFVRLTDVLARLEQGFGANSAPVTTIKRHFEMQAAPAHPAEGVPQAVTDEREAFVNWLHGTYPNSYSIIQAADLWFHKHVAALAWKARAALAATHPTQQGLDARRWQIVHDHISGEYIAGRACFVVHVQPMSGANIMRGSVAEHFTKAVDDIAAQIKIAAQAKQGEQANG